MTLKYKLPTREERDRLILGVFGHDPQPPACAEHGNAAGHARNCGQCGPLRRWQRRMLKRFNRQGLAFAFAERTYAHPDGDPQPAACPAGHGDCCAGARAGCDPCRLIRNWRAREYAREHRAGLSRRLTDRTDVYRHVKMLRQGDMTLDEIARAAGCGVASVTRILSDTDQRPYISVSLTQRLLAIPVPGRRFDLVASAVGQTLLRVDATGTRRRLQAACRNGYPLKTQAHKLGYSYNTVREWLRTDTVTIQAAQAVAQLYPTLIDQPGPDPAAARLAATKGWLNAKYFGATTIDDANYQPLRRTDASVVRRQLRGLAWMGHGPEQVGREIGEKPADVWEWTEGGSYPAYVTHLVNAVYDRWSGRFGPARNAARHAREQRWPSPAAWHGIDISNWQARAQTDIADGHKKTQIPLDSQIFQALAGVIGAADLVHAEKVAVVRALHRRGWSDRRIGVWLRWCTNHKDASTAVSHFRNNYGIKDRPGINNGGHSTDDDFIVTPAA